MNVNKRLAFIACENEHLDLEQVFAGGKDMGLVMKCKKFLSLIIVIALLCTLAQGIVWADEEPVPAVTLEGQAIEFNETVQPNIRDGHTLVPLRALAEKMGYDVVWNEPQILLTKDAVAVTFTAGDTEVLVNGDRKECPRAPEIVDGVTLIPVRFFCETVGYSVDFMFADDIPCINIYLPEKDFSADLLPYMPNDVNYMVSPFSIKMALAMAANGASGQTKEEMLNVLGIDDLNAYNVFAKEILQRLNENDKVDYIAANSIWFNTDYYPNQDVAFQDSFRSLIVDFYEGICENVTNENAVSSINNWISEQTNGLIENVISDPDFLAALVNTIYFKGAWAVPFSESLTAPGTFTDRSGKQSEVDFMHDVDYYQYYENDDMQLLAIPYEDRNFEMMIALPKGDATPSFTDGIFDSMKIVRVDLALPKFETEYSADLSDILKNMGMPRAFADNAQFAEEMFVNSPDPIKIDNVLHKTKIKVDEKGTIAAAATVISMGAGSPMPTEPVDFHADRPVLYLIRDSVSGEILFLGEYAFAD